MKNFYWETEPDQEHMAYNFDIAKVGGSARACWAATAELYRST